MTESEYKQLSEFQNLPLYDEGDPRTSTIELSGEENPDGKTWITVHEATDLKTAKEYLQDSKLVPKGGVRFWDEDQPDCNVFAYFWEKKQS